MQQEPGGPGRRRYKPQLSILYLRCHNTLSCLLKYLRCSFNSLFEMRHLGYVKVVIRFPDSFNSLFEMRTRVAPLGRTSARTHILSILYLRCVAVSAVVASAGSRAFNSLFKMPLRQRHARHLKRVHDFQFSI